MGEGEAAPDPEAPRAFPLVLVLNFSPGWWYIPPCYPTPASAEDTGDCLSVPNVRQQIFHS